jgi:hypothetical protein
VTAPHTAQSYPIGRGGLLTILRRLKTSSLALGECQAAPPTIRRRDWLPRSLFCWSQLINRSNLFGSSYWRWESIRLNHHQHFAGRDWAHFFRFHNETSFSFIRVVFSSCRTSPVQRSSLAARFWQSSSSPFIHSFLSQPLRATVSGALDPTKRIAFLL